MSAPRLRVSHLGLCVSDWRRSLAFYGEALGFRYVHEIQVKGPEAGRLLGLEDVSLRAIYLEREGVRIELLHYESPGHVAGPAPRPMNQLGLTHLSLRVEDLDAAVASLRAAGAAIHEETRIDLPAAGVKAVFVSDPDGTRIELVQQPGD
jgi:catechol 2,3-dioxygenase-like lactoylglutathione lyase family enzyme